MLNLSYAACYDPYHTVFRMVSILLNAPNKTLSFDILRIADFFICFPSRLNELKPPNSVPGMRGRKNAVVKDIGENTFEILPRSDILFERMEVIQETAISAMISKGIVRFDHSSSINSVTLVVEAISNNLMDDVTLFSKKNERLLQLVADDFSHIPVLGQGGLKDRSGLGEWVYDTI